jgi:hypothetical protein
MPSSAIQAEPDQRTPWVTFPGSFIMTRNPPEWPWFSTPTSFIRFEPPPTPAERRADAYAGLLHGLDYLEDALDHLREADDDAVRHALEVIRAIVDVALGLLGGSSSSTAH